MITRLVRSQFHRRFFVDSLLVVLSLGVGFISVAKLTSRSLAFNESQTSQVGIVTHSIKDTRFRPTVGPAFFPLSLQQPVYANETIYAGDGSEVVIDLGDGQSIEVASNSLVVLKVKPAEQPQPILGWLRSKVLSSKKLGGRRPNSSSRVQVKVLKGRAKAIYTDLEKKGFEPMVQEILPSQPLPSPTEQVTNSITKEASEVIILPTLQSLEKQNEDVEFTKTPTVGAKEIYTHRYQFTPTFETRPTITAKSPLENLDTTLKKETLADERQKSEDQSFQNQSARSGPQNIPSAEEKIASTTSPETSRAQIGKPRSLDSIAKALPIERKPDALIDQGLVSVLPKAFKKWLFQFSGGANYATFSQEVATTGQTLKYDSFAGPSLNFDVAYRFSHRWSWRASYRQMPGEIGQNAGQPTLTYNWQTVGSHLNYQTARQQQSRHRWGFSGGLLHQQLPFLRIQPGNQISLEQNKLLNLTVGVDYKTHFSKRLALQIHQRLQTPISSENSAADLDVSGFLAYDGDISLQYQIGQQLTVGMTWLGQYLKYDYSVGGATPLAGEQQLLHSNLEAQLIWEF